MPSAAGIIFSSLNNNTLSRLTSDRTVAAIPFACRYRLIDFSLSNMVNADISNISVVANYNYRSLLSHIGSGKDWDMARRENGINLISPFQNASNLNEAKMYSNHLEALKSMKKQIDELKEDYVIMMDSDNVLNIDLSAVINSHEAAASDITLVTKITEPSFSSKHPRIMLSSNNGRVTDIVLSASHDSLHPELVLGIYVMKTTFLRKIIEEAVAYNRNSFTEYLRNSYKTLKVSSYIHDGYVASVSSFLDYYRCSMEIATDENARESLLAKKDSPIFTRVHNSSPTMYKTGAVVENSMIADECVIEGEVVNSIIFRGVRIAKGAVVKNSVLFRGVHVSTGAHLDSIVADKDVYITENVRLSGHVNMPFYIQKSRKV